jgi:hypothetical protein
MYVAAAAVKEVFASKTFFQFQKFFPRAIKPLKMLKL